MHVTTTIPAIGYLRLPQILGQREVTEAEAARNKQRAAVLPEATRHKDRSPKTPRPAIPPLIPVSKSQWWKGVKTGMYPQPLKLGAGTTVWRAEDIIRFITSR